MSDDFNDESWQSYKRVVLGKLDSLESLIKESYKNTNQENHICQEQTLRMIEKLDSRIRKLEDSVLIVKSHAGLVAGIVGGTIAILSIIAQIFIK